MEAAESDEGVTSTVVGADADEGARVADMPESLAADGSMEEGFRAGEDEDWMTTWSPAVGWRTLEAGWGAPATCNCSCSADVGCW